VGVKPRARRLRFSGEFWCGRWQGEHSWIKIARLNNEAVTSRGPCHSQSEKELQNVHSKTAAERRGDKSKKMGPHPKK